MQRSRLVLVAAGLAGAVALWFAFAPGSAPGTVYSFAEVAEGPIVSAVSTSGTVQPAASVIVGSQLSGQISEVLVDFNSVVREGDVLARLDPKTYEARVRQNQALLAVAKARVTEAEAQVRRAEVELEDARRDFRRREALRKGGNLSERDYDIARTRLDTADVGLDLARAQLLNARAAVLQQEATLNQAEIDLERTYIRAPITGVVIKREVEPGQTVAASLQAPTLFELVTNLTEMEVQARVDEADIGRVAVGQTARFSVDAFPGRTFQGTVTQIQKSPKEVQNVITYTVLVSAPNPDERLLPGLTAKLDIVVGEKERAVRVPAQALRFRPRAEDGAAARPTGAPAGGATGGAMGRLAETDPQVATVWTLGDSGQPQPVRIRLGLGNADWAEVLDGPLKPGDRLIVRADRQGADQRPAGLRF